MASNGRRARLAAALAALAFAGLPGPVAAGEGGGAITPQNAAKVKQAASFSGHKGPVFGLAASADGALLASAGIDMSVRLWDVGARKPSRVLEGHTKQAIAVGFRADGATLLSAGYEPAVRLWDVKTGKGVETQKQNPKDDLQRLGVWNVFTVFDAGAKVLATTSDVGVSIDLWDTEGRTKKEILPREDKGAAGHFHRMAFGADGRWLAAQVSVGEDAAVVDLWDRKAGAWTQRLAGAEKSFVANEGLAVSPDGSVVASVDVHSSAIQLWDAKSGKRGFSLTGHKHDADSEQMLISGLEFSPDGALLASASYDKTVRLWDVATGKELVSLPSHRDGAGAVVWSPDGRWLASADLDGTVEVWALP